MGRKTPGCVEKERGIVTMTVSVQGISSVVTTTVLSSLAVTGTPMMIVVRNPVPLIDHVHKDRESVMQTMSVRALDHFIPVHNLAPTETTFPLLNTPHWLRYMDTQTLTNVASESVHHMLNVETMHLDVSQMKIASQVMSV